MTDLKNDEFIDEALQSMGVKFTDETQNNTERKACGGAAPERKAPVPYATSQNPAQERNERVTAANLYADRNEERKPIRKSVEETASSSWEPVKPQPNWMDKLKACAFGVLTFGGLAMLLFYWQQAGLMASEAAVPSMCVCTALAGWSIGKNARGSH